VLCAAVLVLVGSVAANLTKAAMALMAATREELAGFGLMLLLALGALVVGSLLPDPKRRRSDGSGASGDTIGVDDDGGDCGGDDGGDGGGGGGDD
jgi:hypothetical protein